MGENGNCNGESCGRCRGDQMRAGASLHVSYTWIRHIGILHPTSYAKYASNPTLMFLGRMGSLVNRLIDQSTASGIQSQVSPKKLGIEEKCNSGIIVVVEGSQ